MCPVVVVGTFAEKRFKLEKNETSHADVLVMNNTSFDAAEGDAVLTGIMRAPQDGVGGGGGGRTRKITLPPLEACVGNQQDSGAGTGTGQHYGTRRASRRMSSNWKRRMSFAALGEVLPSLDLYRLGGGRRKRPSIGELHGDNVTTRDDGDAGAGGGGGGDVEAGGGGHGIKLGWIQGVFIPCLLNIWGVMLFLRLSWVVAQAGILQSLVIISVSYVVCVLTTLSLSAISTNGEVKGGGIYYIISRSLGPEFGASVGVVFAFANAVAAAMNTIGFCSSLNDLLKESGLKIVDGDLNDIRIVGVIAILVMIVICAVGMDWETKAQNFLLVIIAAAIGIFVIGACVGPTTDEERAQGFVGLSTKAFAENWGPDYHYSEGVTQSFFTVFAIFFPSVTGIQAGANISGDLKDPSSSIPKGTLLSLLVSMASYVLFVLMAGGAAVRDASGNVADLVGGWPSSACRNDDNNTHCEYGLGNSYTAMQLISYQKYIIYAGCFAATLSTALTNLLSVPKLIQALGQDRIYPGLLFFSKGYGKLNEPYRGYVLTFLISVVFLLIADLNLIAPLISNFYLASYALINFCTFHAALIKPLGWRPTFRYYNLWLSLLGFFLCIAIMFLIDYMASVITIVVIFALYLIVVYRKPDVNWGSSTQAQTYKTALNTVHRLAHIGEHVKNYRPQVLALCGPPRSRPALVDFANLITKNNSLLVCGEIASAPLPHRERLEHAHNANLWLRSRKIKAFYSLVDGLRFEEGAKALLQTCGIGKLKPNVLLMGFKADWRTASSADLLAYFNVLHDAFDNRVSVGILRLEDGLDYSRLLESDHMNDMQSTLTLSVQNLGMLHAADSNLNISSLPGARSEASLTGAGLHVNGSTVFPADSPSAPKRNASSPLHSILKMKKKAASQQVLNTVAANAASTVPMNDLAKMTLFDRRQKKGSIDVWWLYDDGGLTMLLPYIISTRTTWANCQLRVFALTNKKQELEMEERNMASLLSKFRIDYASLTMIHDISESPREETVAMFNKLLDGFREEDMKDGECVVTQAQQEALQDKTNRQLRLRELLLENSKDASLVVMSLPMPRKGLVSAPLYMAWLEMLTRDLPPYLLVRGNHTSVLTFYS
ncbi:Bumetanide-sensitive sodium-(potassium)-chloride cotransporter [Frankliniella fusca]|uniref:Bumetanide-sensitive sodium-(Potassium)-chloride cotransporter n=1 Tax=Frankliniella fusca TaxID=407009 RepID=A0AAE1HXA7_9NEOP|nr:Bumetanide-sensitive sodium-(potassium)-chloride cotransporter [Frankliniella fusca]